MVDISRPIIVDGLLLANGAPLDVSQYIGIWAMEETRFQTQWGLLTATDLAAHVASSQVPTASVLSEPDSSGIATILISGTMTKKGSSFSTAGSTIRARQAMREARLNPDVAGVMVIIESPGGTVAGTKELVDAYAALSEAKPTVTYAEDLMASAGLWVGVQGRKVFANTNDAVIGSMGAIIALYDFSGHAAKEGIKPVVLRTGELKGAGIPGTEITDAQKAMWQALVDEAFAAFSSSVQVRRNANEATMKELSRAGVYPAKQAVSLGLIDGVLSYDQAMAELKAMISPKRKGSKAMSERENQPQAASLTQIEAVCGPGNESFVLDQMRRSATLEDVRSAWSRKQDEAIASLRNQLATSEAKVKELTEAAVVAKSAADKEIGDLKAKLEDAEKRASQRAPVGAKGSEKPAAGAGGGGDPAAVFEAAIKVRTDRGLSRRQALADLNDTEPQIYQDYLDAANAGRKPVGK